MGRDPPFESEVAAIILPNFRDRGLTIAVAIHSTLQELAKLANHALNIALFELGLGGIEIVSRSLVFENIFLPPSGPRFTSNSRATQFDNLTKRGKANSMY
jgi:hypothetical protein